MDLARLPDTDLLRLVRHGGEASLPALRELEQRHFQAVRGFASACAVNSSAADDLAAQAWERALRGQDSAAGAVRPHVLTVLLRTAGDWSGTGQRSALDFDLAIWIENHPPEFRGGASGAYFHSDSLTARAFLSLPPVSQTVLWHDAVEQDDSSRILLLLGEGAEDVPLLSRRARRELYNAYVQIHQDEMQDEECARFHRMMLAYVDQKTVNTAADIVPHLEECPYCTRAIADLGRMHADCGTLLAEALLPWGGEEYAASGRRPAAVLSGSGEGAGEGAGAETDDGAGVRGAQLAGAGAAKALLPGSHGPRGARNGDGLRRKALVGLGFAGGKATGRRLRAKRVTQTVAFLGLCSLAAAFVYAGAVGPGSPQSNESAPPGKVPPAPSPPTPTPSPSTATKTATATSTVTATRSPSRPPGSPSAPPVRGAALEWVFDDIKDGVAKDTSKNGREGKLVGDPLPKVLKSGAVQFAGQQSVAADGAVVDTDSSFTVSAWAKMDNKDEFQTVISQDGTDVSGFQLQYDPDEDDWEMRVHKEDDDDANADEASSRSEPEAGVWTHLTGVYDDPDDEIRLYVDGELEDSTDRDGEWEAGGDFAVGRALAGDQFVRGFEGAIDDVRAFRRVLSSAEVARLADSR